MDIFAIFKSAELKEKEKEVNETGRELFRQIALFRNAAKAQGVSNEETIEKFKHPYAAGYMSGFIDMKIGQLFVSDNEKGKYMGQIIDGIFPGKGIDYLKSHYIARKIAEGKMYEDGAHAAVYQENAVNYDSGLEDGRQELSQWDLDKSYKPHKLFDFLNTGELF